MVILADEALFYCLQKRLFSIVVQYYFKGSLSYHFVVKLSISKLILKSVNDNLSQCDHVT
jgi:hypothetical protein